MPFPVVPGIPVGAHSVRPSSVELPRRHVQHFLHASLVGTLAVDADDRLRPRLAEKDPRAVGEIELHAVDLLARGDAAAEERVDLAGADALDQARAAVHWAMEVAAVVVQ